MSANRIVRASRLVEAVPSFRLSPFLSPASWCRLLSTARFPHRSVKAGDCAPCYSFRIGVSLLNLFETVKTSTLPIEHSSLDALLDVITSMTRPVLSRNVMS